MRDGNTQKVVDYLDGFQYAGGILQFFPTAEGYVKATQINESPTNPDYAFNYVFNYTDHLGNVRLSFSKDPVTNQLKIMEENHYYPFGLKHSVYAGGLKDYKENPSGPGTTVITNVTETDWRYYYQGQERQDELGLNWDSFKWRNYDYAIGRFMSIDPLAEKYTYNSPYAFQENKLGMGIELEGLEMVSNLGRSYHWGPLNAPQSTSTTSSSKMSYGKTENVGGAIAEIILGGGPPEFYDSVTHTTTTTSYSYSSDGIGSVNSISDANNLDVTTTTRTITVTEKEGFGIGGNKMEANLKVETNSTVYAIEGGEVLGVADLGGTHNSYSTTQNFDLTPQELPSQVQSAVKDLDQANSDILIGTLRSQDLQDDFQRMDWERNMESYSH